MKTKAMALAAICVGAVSPHAVAAPNGPFIGIMGGANFSGDQDTSGRFTINRSVDTDTGWVAVPSIGYRYGNGLRTELELGYRKNQVDGITGAPSADGDVKVKSLMLNLLYDMNTASKLKPYVGAGIGYAMVKYDNVNPIGIGGITDKDDVLAYQGMAGVSYAVTQALELAAEYRYFATRDPDMRTSTGLALETEYDSHSALVGLRWNFGTPKAAPVAQRVTQAAPAAPAAPAPVQEEAALPRNFQVFFDWDRSDLTAEAQSILGDAGNYAKANQAVRIVTTGHADRSGSEEYNMALSMRRAETVRQSLLAMGIAESEISVDAKGETDPLVPTDDGVREPQNRRVEIVLQ